MVALYFPTVSGGFTTWDDPDAVIRNRALQTVAEGPLGERILGALALFHPARLRLGDYAPIAQLSLALDRAIGDGSPAPFHATNVVLHAIAAALVFLVGCRLGAWPAAALLGAFLFAVHPVQVEPVSWASCRGRLLASVFGLVALFVQLGAGPARTRTWGAALFLGLGLLSKISALAYLPAVLLAGGSPRRQVPVVAVAVGAVAVLLVSRLGPAAPESVELGRLLLLGDGLMRYLEILGSPGSASIFHAIDHLGDGLGWGILPGLLVLGGLPFLAPPPTRRIACALLLGSALLYLPNVVIRSGVSPVADRYLYEPLAALAWLLGAAVVGTRSWRAIVATGLVVIAILVPINRTRQGVWADPVRLWSDAAERYPEHPFVWLQLGVAAEGNGDGVTAAHAYRAHLERQPESAVGLNNLARVLARQGQTEQALPLLDRALEIDPEVGPVWFNRGEVLMSLGRRAAAFSTFRKAVALQPSLAEAHNALGVMLMAERRDAEARASFEAAIAARPDRPNAHYNLGWLLARQGHLEVAERHYREAIRLSPGYKRAHNNLGLVLLRTGRGREAISALGRALEIDPGFEEARVNLGNAYLQLGVAEWAEVVRQNPARQGVVEQLERLRAAGLLGKKENRGTDDSENPSP
ncbi:MAG: tetratricopeptide repeat protein [Myxococcota bacterium]